MVKPRALEAGSRLAIVAPASPFSREELDRGLDEVRRLGFVPVYDESIFDRHRAYLAGSPEVRARAVRTAWSDPSITGLMAVRGGYGSAQILPLLDGDEMARTPKVFVGYSDVTALLTFLTTGWGVVAFHGPMLDQRLSRGVEGYDRDSFLNAVCRREPLGELTTPDVEAIRRGEIAGPLFGGTLTQLVASLGTPFAFSPPAGHVLFLDEVGERPYRIDRMMTQLRQSGLLARAVAVVVGELPRCDEPSGAPAGRAVVADLLGDFPGPVLMGFPSGHTAGPTMTLPLGVMCRVVANASPRLVIEEAAVE